MKGSLTIIVLIFLSFAQTACVTTVWTGATMIYDRHSVYKQVNDVDLAIQTRKVLFDEIGLGCTACNVDIAVFHGDVLIAGSVPNLSLRQEVYERLQQVGGYRNLYRHLAIGSNSIHPYLDAWITSKIRTGVFSDERINPGLFKVVTVNQIVYILGELTESQAELVLAIAQDCKGVLRVVKLFRSYHLVDDYKSPSMLQKKKA